ncbi:MAG: hypothetical protein A3I32_01575 [Candidatus Yanofskybacteria bacterium RIFCSPLOWO2_02_FULL_45_10]|uniref:Peptidase M50 domain-containing protein n=1 Tax=Candidatus Yanofskybacteria bacterium RIFCSPLOWO2_02_FULL_45_10 TaxID=1802706 RepID=A0A1F8H5Z0_9BACT|nr:MAG: hypothetical protein A3I32_01575 [Candidatus Yanofskybacteria bacterium RIFCSPLOWO2_02_FULL_45_10]
MITFIIFIVVLGVLVLVHELGHLIVAKWCGMKVEEFGFGFPPRLWGKKMGGTTYSINSIPFGGFVKITGEDGENKNEPNSFAAKSATRRAATLVAGVLMNILLAFALLVVVNFFGVRTQLDENQVDKQAKDLRVQIIQIVDNSPAVSAGLNNLDEITGFRWGGQETKVASVSAVQNFISAHKGQKIVMLVRRGDQLMEKEIVPRVNPPAGEGSLGISLALTGEVSYPFFKAIAEAGKQTWWLFANIVIGFATIIKNIFTQGSPGADLSGPIGIAQYTGQAARVGWSYLLQFVALISVNLAVLNLIPFPALDGGRLLFVGLEKLRRKPMPHKVEAIINTIGFALLILLMIYVTTKDVIRFW